MNALTKTIVLAGTTALLGLMLSTPVSAQARWRGVRVAPRAYVYAPVYSPFIYDPFWTSYYAPYGAYSYAVAARGDVRLEVAPKQTQVYVDGYYAGVANDFDGVFQHLHTTPGGHAITLYLNGYRTITQDIYVRPDSTYKMVDAMEKLPKGETSAPVPLPLRSLARGSGSSRDHDNPQGHPQS